MSKRSCDTCKHTKCSIVQEPCKSCSGYQAGYSNWEKGNQEIINLIAENKRLKEEARSVISFAAKTEIETLRAQLAEKDKKIERLKEKTWCAYCGFEIDLDDSAASKISEHIKMCSKHPIRAYERHCEELEKENAELRERLKASEKGVIK